MDTPKSLVRFGLSILLIIIMVLSFTACSGENSSYEIFIPPTAISEPTSQPSYPATEQQDPIPPFEPLQSTFEINCTNSLRYIEDLTFPDGSLVSPGTEVDKQWQVENTGTCNWDFRYSLRIISGDDLGIELEQALFPARSGSRVIIHINFKAPDQAGTYSVVWQAFDPSYQPFGDPISILFNVSK